MVSRVPPIPWQTLTLRCGRFASIQHSCRGLPRATKRISAHEALIRRKVRIVLGFPVAVSAAYDVDARKALPKFVDGSRVDVFGGTEDEDTVAALRRYGADMLHEVGARSASKTGTM